MCVSKTNFLGQSFQNLKPYINRQTDRCNHCAAFTGGKNVRCVDPVVSWCFGPNGCQDCGAIRDPLDWLITWLHSITSQ